MYGNVVACPLVEKMWSDCCDSATVASGNFPSSYREIKQYAVENMEKIRLLLRNLQHNQGGSC
jgi:hypothetical protein